MDATLTSKGQITLPKPIRDALSLKPGDRISFTLEGPRRVRMEPNVLSVKAIRGVFKSTKKKVVSLRAMQQAIRKRGSTL